jgi:glyoxylate reductase
MDSLPRVMADGPLAHAIETLLRDKVELVPWLRHHETSAVDGVYTYGHPLVDGELLDRLKTVRVISNYGVGVDHIRLRDAAARNIPVTNTPGILEATTADMAFTLLLATARRLIEGDQYARSLAFDRYDPGYMLGREVHHATIGIVGMGKIGEQIARRALAFDMTVLYHNRRRREEVESRMAARYAPLNDLLMQSDFVVLSVPLTDETRGMIGQQQFSRMKPTAILINVARGPVVDTSALTDALQQRRIYAAGLDVTDPEPLPRDHPLLRLSNVVIAPHLGSATEQTRQKMAELSVENLLDGLAGKTLRHRVQAAS